MPSLFVYLTRELDLADVEGVRALRALSNLKRNCISFTKLVERNVLELIAVEEEILFLTLLLDETKTLVGLFGYDTLVHRIIILCF